MLLIIAVCVIFAAHQFNENYNAKDAHRTALLDFARNASTSSATPKSVFGETALGMCVLYQPPQRNGNCISKHFRYDDDTTASLLIDYGARVIAIESQNSGRGIRAWSAGGNECITSSVPFEITAIPGINNSMAGADIKLLGNGRSSEEYCSQRGKTE